MNGRVYDYNIGRFMSVDPFVHGGSQGINPYSYILNNPLSGTDPSGYSPEPDVETKTMMVSTTGSKIKHKVTVSATQNSDGSVTVTFSGNNGAAVSAAKDMASSALAGNDFEVADLGGQGSIAASPSKPKETSETQKAKDVIPSLDNVGSGSSGGESQTLLPETIKIEADGFADRDAAAKAAGERYGAEGTENEQEVQLGIIRISEGNWGYLTPGWGEKGATLVDPNNLLDAYQEAGFTVRAWLHGHWDAQLKFSAQDYPNAWFAPGVTYLVNRNLEVRKLTRGYLDKKFKRMPQHYKKLGVGGLQAAYKDGLDGEKL